MSQPATIGSNSQQMALTKIGQILDQLHEDEKQTMKQTLKVLIASGRTVLVSEMGQTAYHFKGDL